MGAMLTEIIGDIAARCYLTETRTKKTAIIRKALTGEDRAKVEDWLLRSTHFPMAGYAARPMLAREQAAA